MTNAPKFISQSESSAPKLVMADDKLRTDVSILSGETGAILTLEKLILRKKRSMKSPAMSPLRKDPILNQDINRLITKKDQNIPPHFEKFPPGSKSFLNDANDPNSTDYDLNDSTDTSRNEKEDSVNNMRVTNNKDIDDKYKDENSKSLNSNESFINKT